MSLEKMIHKGSTKDVYASGDHYLFRFSDRYSVFDWGEMPDHIDGKGKALARFTKAVYEKLNVKHHILNIPAGENEIRVRPFEVVRDGSSLKEKNNVFIPLEVIFRLGYAKGSSIQKRFKSKEDWLKSGFDREYNELEMFSSPFIEFTTKLERFDRPLTHNEAKELSALSDKEWNSLLDTTTKIALKLRDLFESNDIHLWDGKIELALDENRNIVLVDSIGPDELRLTKNGVQLSKEIIRQHYRNSEWYQQLDVVKTKHGADFKQFISAPPQLPKEFKASVEELYIVLADCMEKPGECDLAINKICSRLRSFL